MNTHRFVHRRVRNCLGVVALIGVFAMATATAQASGSWHGIGGTVKEDGTWYFSATERVMSSGNRTIKVDFVTVNSKGLNFMCVDWNSGRRIGIPVSGPPTNVDQTIGAAASGEHFRNAFQAQSSGREKDYNFSASEFF